MAINYEDFVKLMDKRKRPGLGQSLAGMAAAGAYGLLGKPVPEQLYQTFGGEQDPMGDTITKELIRHQFNREAEKEKMALQQTDPYRQSQIALNKKIIESMESPTGGNLIYRDPETGMEIPQEQALQDILQGKQYITARRSIGRQGVKEDIISKPEDLTQEEKTYLITSNRVSSTLNDLIDAIHPNLQQIGGNKDWQAFQAQNFPYAAITSQPIEDYKSAIVQLKSDIPFLRGGKQLTATEAKRVDVLLNPFGKSRETLTKDIERFKNEFGFGADIMKRGIRAINRPMKEPMQVLQQQQQQQQQQQGGQMMIDAQGNKAIVYPDGTYEEVQ